MAGMAALLGGSLLGGLPSYRIGVSSAKPHDPERLKKAEAKRARKAARGG